MKNLENLFEENNINLETLNVDFEMAMIEACMDEEESFVFEGDEYEVTVDYSDAESVWGTTTEALTNAQRRKKAVQMKKGKASRLRKKKIAEKKLSSPDKIKAKSSKKARKIIEKKLLKGKDKSELSYSQRAALEKKVDKKKGAISRIAKRVKKDVKKADRERVKSRRSPKKEDVQYDEGFLGNIVKGVAEKFDDAAVKKLIAAVNNSTGLQVIVELRKMSPKKRANLKRAVDSWIERNPNDSNVKQLARLQTSLNEDVQYDEAFRFSQGHKHTENAINLLSKTLQPGSALMKGVNKDLGGDYRSAFAKMGDLIDDIENVWIEIGRDYATQNTSFGEDTEVLEEKSLEQKNTLTKAEYDEVQNFSNFDKKDWKKQGSKYVRIKPVKEDFTEGFKVGQKVKVARGPHTKVTHEIIAVLDNGRYNVKPVGMNVKDIKYKQGAAGADAKDLTVVKEEVTPKVINIPTGASMQPARHKKRAGYWEPANKKTMRVTRGGNYDVVDVEDRYNSGRFYIFFANNKHYMINASAISVVEDTNFEEATNADVKKVLASAKDGGDVKGNTIDFGEGSVIKVSLEKGKIKFDGGKSSGVELFDTAKDAIAALEDAASEGEQFNEDNEYVIVTDKDTKTFPKSRPGLKKAYDAVAKSKIWVIYYVDKNGKQEIVDSSDN